MNAMMRREFVISALGFVAGLSTRTRVFGQGNPQVHDLAALADANRLEVFNRSASSFTEGTKRGVRLTQNAGDGVAYVQGLELANGMIEIDLRGKDLQQQSFLGVAFHGVDAQSYDAVYFRPFNFKAEEPARRVRAVQYVSHPTHTWDKLREMQPGRYEKGVNPVPDPNGWFHARIVVASPEVSVFVDGAMQPSLVVEQLSSRKKGRAGLWVGNGSAGDFADLRISVAV